jgi:hypothetical protein
MTDEKHKTISNSDEANDTNSGRAKISERKLAANRANAQKSTGPRTQRGKSSSRLNSFKHGLLAQKVMFDDSGKLLDPELFGLYEALCEQYGTDDIRVQLLLDTLIMDYWRMKQALEKEVTARSGTDRFLLNPWIPQVQRYATANRNSFMKNLDLLSKTKQADEEDAEAGEEGPQPYLRADETQSDKPERTAANPTKPASDIEIPRPSIEETGAGRATELPTLHPAETAGPDDREGVPQSDLPAAESQSDKPESTEANPTVAGVDIEQTRR